VSGLSLGPSALAGAPGASRPPLNAGALVSASLDSAPTVPSGVGRLGTLRRGDLKIVRQRLKRYEAVEIAHIENVMHGESNRRTFTRAEKSVQETIVSRAISTSEERDLQSTERFELKSAVKESLRTEIGIEAGVSVSASYGPTVGVEAESSFTGDFAHEKTSETATTFARETTSRAQSRIEEQVSESRATRQMQRVKEVTDHRVDNSKNPGGHVQGIYRWVNKIYEAQVVNYGVRDLYNFYVPEPAALWRSVQAQVPVSGLTLPEPQPPRRTFDDGTSRPLRPSDVTEDNYMRLVAKYGATDVSAPPLAMIRLSAVLEATAATDRNERWGTVSNKEFMIPTGYEATEVRFAGGGIPRGGSNVSSWYIQFGGNRYLGKKFDPAAHGGDGETTEGDYYAEWIAIGRRTGAFPLLVEFSNYLSLGVSVGVRCERTYEAFETWQLAAFDGILTGYFAQRAAYDNEVRNANAAHEARASERPAAEREITVRTELKRSVLSILTGQRFEEFDAVRPPGGTQRYPEIAFPDAAAEGRYVAFCEQAFEWENMTFILYPYFWGRKAEWASVLQIEDSDLLFAQFLRAGFARVQIPVRPRYEASVRVTFAPENWSGETWVGEDVPGFEQDGILEIDEEMAAQTGGDLFVQGEGTVSLTAGTAVVTGRATRFTDDDVDREIRIDGVVYRVTVCTDETSITIEPPPAASAVDRQYGLGAKLDGQPWEISVPTTLVLLQKDAALNP
jgi:hypothetical protein